MIAVHRDHSCGYLLLLIEDLGHSGCRRRLAACWGSAHGDEVLLSYVNQAQ